MPQTLYLGLDVQADISSFCLLTEDKADKPQNGRVNLDGFPKLLEDSKPQFLACEFTGRLAVPYARIAQAHGLKVYFLDTVSRSAYTRLFGQTSKTDKQDAKTIAQVFRRWAEHEEEYKIRPHLFLDAELIEDAWTLRAMLFELRKLRQFKTSCELKTQIAAKTLLPDVASRWMEIAASLPLDKAEKEILAYTTKAFPDEMTLLLTIPGVGPTLAPWLIAVLHPVHRFDTYWKAKRYIGLNPRQNETGEKKSRQYVSRTGNSTLRSLLYLSALSQLGEKNQTRFGDFYRRKSSEGMPGKRAVVATAERIFRTAFHVLRTGTKYHDPTRPAPEPKENRPEHLITQADAAKALGVSRQAVSQQVKSGKLRAEEWQGKMYVIQKYLDIALQNKATAEAAEAAEEEEEERPDTGG